MPQSPPLQTLDSHRTPEPDPSQPQTLIQPHPQEEAPPPPPPIEQPETLRQEQEEMVLAIKREILEPVMEVDEEEIECEDETSEAAPPDVPVPAVEPPAPNPPRRKVLASTDLARKKLEVLRRNFNPVRFSPAKTLDFSAHEELFRALNLWEFAGLDRSSQLRPDLLALLIANYDASKRRSFVCGAEISIHRADVARGLNLPLGRGDEEGRQGLLSGDEAKQVIMAFVSNYILLQDEEEDEMCILPEEVVAANHLVREGKADVIDWAGLMLALLQKELIEVPQCGTCRYASYLQFLIQCQQPGLFDEGGAGEDAVAVPEPESSMEVSDSSNEEDEEFEDDSGAEDGDNDGADDVGDYAGYELDVRSLEEMRDMGYSNQGLGLSPNGGEAGEFMNGIEQNGEGGWISEETHQPFDHCLRRCNSNDVRSMEFENLCNEDHGERDDGFANLERLTSTDLMHTMDSAPVSCSPRMHSLMVDGHKNELADPAPGGSFLYENNGKRHIDNVDIDDDDDDVSQFHQGNHQKRMRCVGSWEEQRAPSGIDPFMEQINYAIGKAKSLYNEKEQACVDAQLQLQYLNQMLEQKDQIIKTLEKMQVEERQKWQHNLCQYENELNVLAQLVVGYKTALKETQMKFDDYRKKCPEGEEMLYKDVPGGGGLVLTAREVEQLRVEKEQEMCRVAEEMISAFECDCCMKFQQHHEDVLRLFNRLGDLSGEVKVMKEEFAERKSKDT